MPTPTLTPFQSQLQEALAIRAKRYREQQPKKLKEELPNFIKLLKNYIENIKLFGDGFNTNFGLSSQIEKIKNLRSQLKKVDELAPLFIYNDRNRCQLDIEDALALLKIMGEAQTTDSLRAEFYYKNYFQPFSNIIWNYKSRIETELDVLNGRSVWHSERYSETRKINYPRLIDVKKSIFIAGLDGHKSIESFLQYIARALQVAKSYAFAQDPLCIAAAQKVVARFDLSEAAIDALVYKSFKHQSKILLEILLAHPKATPNIFLHKRKDDKYGAPERLSVRSENSGSIYHTRYYPLLHIAIKNGWKEIALILLKAKSTLDIYSEVKKQGSLYKRPKKGEYRFYTGPAKQHDTVYHSIARYGREEFIDLLKPYDLAQTSNMQRSNQRNRTALHSAAKYNQLGVVKKLLSHIDVNQKDHYGETALHVAIRYGAGFEVVEALVEGGAQVDIVDNHMRTALHYAAKYSSAEVVGLLLEKGASVSLKDAKGKTPLHMAAKNLEPSNVAIVKALIARDATLVNSQDSIGRTPIFDAVKYNNQSLHELLFDNEKSLAIRDQVGNTLLHEAVWGCIEKGVYYDLRNHASINAQTRYGNIEAVQWILEKQPNLVRGENNNHETPLQYLWRNHDSFDTNNRLKITNHLLDHNTRFQSLPPGMTDSSTFYHNQFNLGFFKNRFAPSMRKANKSWDDENLVVKKQNIFSDFGKFYYTHLTFSPTEMITRWSALYQQTHNQENPFDILAQQQGTGFVNRYLNPNPTRTQSIQAFIRYIGKHTMPQALKSALEKSDGITKEDIAKLGK